MKRYTIKIINDFFRDNLASYLEQQDQRTPGFNGQAVTFTLQLMKSPPEKIEVFTENIGNRQYFQRNMFTWNLIFANEKNLWLK